MGAIGNRQVVYSHDGRHVATAHDWNITLWDFNSDGSLTHLPVTLKSKFKVRDVQFHVDGELSWWPPILEFTGLP